MADPILFCLVLLVYVAVVVFILIYTFGYIISPFIFIGGIMHKLILLGMEYSLIPIYNSYYFQIIIMGPLMGIFYWMRFFFEQYLIGISWVMNYDNIFVRGMFYFECTFLIVSLVCLLIHIFSFIK